MHADCVLMARYVAAAREINYAAQVLKPDGQTMEKLRFWQYVFRNGKDSLFDGYAVSTDLYVLFAWGHLGGLAKLLAGLLVAEVSSLYVFSMPAVSLSS